MQRFALGLAVSCAVSFLGCGPSVSSSPGDAAPTWYRDVEPIVAARCAGCHVAGGIAPFELSTYDQVQAQLPVVLDAVQARRMPPWMPDEACHPLRDSRRLEQAEVDTLVAWAAAGSKLGNVADQQSSLEVPPAATLAWVDQVLDQGFDYTPRSDRVDDYRCFVMDPKLTGNRDLIAYQVTPGTLAEVHHVLLYTVSLADAQALDAQDTPPGWQCYGGPGTKSPKMVGAWVPGSTTTHYPPQTGVTLYQGDVLVMQVHYNTSKHAPSPDRTTVSLQYSRFDVPYHAQMFPLVQHGFTVPPHSTGATATAEFTMPLDVALWGAAPHMHTRGADIKVERTDAAGQTSCLIDIPKWNFSWQQFYFYPERTGITVPAGDKLKLSCSWNNDTDHALRWGEGTEDEMCLSFLYFTGVPQ